MERLLVLEAAREADKTKIEELTESVNELTEAGVVTPEVLNTRLVEEDYVEEDRVQELVDAGKEGMVGEQRVQELVDAGKEETITAAREGMVAE